LRAAEADMNRLFSQVKTADGRYAAPLAADDEGYMKEYLVKERISVLIVVPVMETMKSRTDVYRSNDLRDALDPWLPSTGLSSASCTSQGDDRRPHRGHQRVGGIRERGVFSFGAHLPAGERPGPYRSSADGPG
jgi:hypothetical protein